MTHDTTLLFLHGVGSGDEKDTWRGMLSAALADVGYPSLDELAVVAPKYAFTLRGTDDNDPIPKISVKSLSGDEAKRHRREFERRTGALEIRIGRHDRGSGWVGADTVVNAALRLAFDQASNYIENARIRAQVLNRVLRKLPQTGRLVIVAHSLGSVVAADLLRRLPPGIEVVGLITIGSPLANRRFHPDGLRSALESPPRNLGWWLNFWNDADPVTTHRGVSSVFPWMLDHRLQLPFGRDSHDAATYLSQEPVARAIGFGLFGSLSREIAIGDRGVDVPPSPTETVALMALRFGHQVKDQLEGERRDRYANALRHVQASTAQPVRARRAEMGQPLPAAVAEIDVDLSDPTSMAPRPRTMHHFSKEEAVVPLISIALADVIRPYEIDVPKDKQRKAMASLTEDMGLGSELGSNVLRAVDQARDVVRAGRGTSWIKWTAIGLGATAIVAGTGGLALAAAPGVAGAAAVTSALAAFGPGGMVGGLITAGTLVGGGGGALSVGLASSGTSAEAVEGVVAAQLSAEILRSMQSIELRPETWMGLIEMGTEVRRERSRLAAISDDSARSVKEANLKLEAIDRALGHLRKLGLDPERDAND